MISIIICSRNSQLNNILLENIANTIGCDYEIISIDNSKNQFSIFEAYNLGISKSSGNYFCFIHDDILIHSQNWGIKLIDIFEGDAKIGLIGVAGSNLKTKMPSAWWNCPKESIKYNIIQHINLTTKETWHSNFQQNIEEVVAIDGVFMFCKKSDNLSFDLNFKGFHNYDLNLSFEVLAKNLKIVVTNQVLLEHFSIGKLDKNWYSSTIKLHRKYKYLFPKTLKNYPTKVLNKIEFDNGTKFCLNLIHHNFRLEAIKLWLKIFYLKPLSKFHFHFFKQIFK
jgi:glycosyltransferase involved in cell wall biosynthesis